MNPRGDAGDAGSRPAAKGVVSERAQEGAAMSARPRGPSRLPGDAPHHLGHVQRLALASWDTRERSLCTQVARGSRRGAGILDRDRGLIGDACSTKISASGMPVP